MRDAEVRRRRQVGIVLLAFVALIVLLTPAIWSVADDLFSGEHFQDMPAMTMSLIVTLFSAIFAALIVHWRSRQDAGRRRILSGVPACATLVSDNRRTVTASSRP